MSEKQSAIIAARFATTEALCQSIEALRGLGYTRLDAWLPFPDEQVEEALGLGASSIPRWSAACGCIGGITAYAVLYWTSVVSYPIVVGGIPPHAPLAFLPITFETTILFSVLGAITAFFFKTGLPRWYRPAFAAKDIEQVSHDGIFLLVGVDGDAATQCEADVQALHPQSLQRVQP